MYQGERVKAPEGTRQISGRNFGIRPPYSNVGRSKRILGDCLPKTQVPAQLVRGCIGADA